MGVIHALNADGDPLVGADDWNADHEFQDGVTHDDGAPVGAPAAGDLPFYIDDLTFDLYVWDSAVWRGPYNLGT
jgi:hypothetical protein